MIFGKIIVKNNYSEKGDLVFRPLIRAYKKMGLDNFLEEDNAVLLGIINDGVFYELFTLQAIDYPNFSIIDKEEFDEILGDMSLEETRLLKKTIDSLVFNKKEKNEIDPDTMKDLAKDRAVEFDAYNRDLTEINPYEKPFGGYNDFRHKCRMLKK